MSFSESIKLLRKKALLSLEEFAKELWVSVISINPRENELTRLNLTAMKAIKTFCMENNLPYEVIANKWIGYSEEITKNE